MKFLDIDFPLNAYRYYSQMRNFIFIMPTSRKLAQEVNLDTMVQLVGWRRDDYYDEDVNKSDHRKAKETCFFDISYMKRCRLRDVPDFEWEANWGSNNIQEWLDQYDIDSADTEVMVLGFVRPTADLHRLNTDGYLNVNTKAGP